MKTQDAEYAERLVALQTPRWKRVLDVQWPYRRHVRHLRLGRTLDIGCGIGRVLEALGADGVGIDHNREAVDIARSRGLVAYVPDEFRSSADAARHFDSLLFAHVLEHLTGAEAASLLREYLPLLGPGGRVVVFTPQEAGFRSDPTHVEFVDFDRAGTLLRDAGLEVEKQYAFPFPRPVGRIFKYNEFVTIARKS